MSKLHTAIGKENEIFQEEDITFGYDSAINNVVTAINSFLSGSEKNIVIGGKVEPYSGGGMNVQVSPVFALNKSEGYCCVDTDTIYPIAVEESDVSQNRIDIVEIKSELTGYDVQDRKFQDPNLDVQTTESVETKKQLSVSVKVKKGEPGSSEAPDTDSGYIKIAEIFIPAAVNSIGENFIYNVTAIQEGDENASWTNETDVTFNPGFVYDLLPKFLVSHLPDGNIKNGMIDSNKLDLGTGTKQVKGTVIPNGQSMNIHGDGYTNEKSVAYMINVLAGAVNQLFKYSNDLLSRYHFAEIVPVAASTENVNISVGGSKTIDGYLCTENTAVLLKDQTDPTENGLYKVGATWTRYPGFDVIDSTTLRNTLFVIANGTDNIGKVYYCNNDLVVTGIDDILFTESILSPKDTPKTVMVRDSYGRSRVADPSDDKDIANKGWVNSLRQSFFDAAHPVGDIFIQYPSKGDFVTKTPEQLYNVNGITSTWAEVDYGGAFFRSNGGNSENFGSGLQGEGLPNITGSLGISGNRFAGNANGTFSATTSYDGGDGCFANTKFLALGASSSSNNSFSAGNAFNYNPGSITVTQPNFNASKSNSIYGGSQHVTPVNYTVKIWRRTA